MHIQRTLLILHFCGAVALSTAAQAQPAATLHDQIPEELKKRDDAFLTLTVENDLFSGNGKDENYTSGVRLTYYNNHKAPPQLVKKIGEVIPVFDTNETTSIYYSLGQNLYTPRDITLRNPNPTDRPYAAFLYGSIGYTTLIDNHIDDIEVTLGVVGPWALGEPTQDFVHSFSGSPDPQGWDSELKNEPGFMLAYQRTWPNKIIEKKLGPLFVRSGPHLGATLGNIYTYASGGFTIQLVPYAHRWQAPPPRVRPAMPGSGYFAVPDDQFSWSIFAGTEGRVVGRNIFLDGNTFSNSPSVDKKYAVMDAAAGFTLSYGRAQLAYSLNWRSREFDGQSDNSLFGSVSLNYRF